MDYLIALSPVLLVLLGWFLGLATLPIHAAIRRRHRRPELMKSIAYELGEIQLTMAWVAYNIRMRNAQVTDKFLDLILPILESYEGPLRDETIIDAIKSSRKLPEEQRANAHRRMQKPNVSLSLRQYSLPLLEAQIADLAICTREFQRSVLSIRFHIEILNQPVPQLQSLFERTFTDLNDANRLVICENLERGYQNHAERAEIVFNAIAELKRHYP